MLISNCELNDWIKSLDKEKNILEKYYIREKRTSYKNYYIKTSYTLELK